MDNVKESLGNWCQSFHVKRYLCIKFAWFTLFMKCSLMKNVSTYVTYTHHLAGNCSTFAIVHPAGHAKYFMSPTACTWSRLWNQPKSLQTWALKLLDFSPLPLNLFVKRFVWLNFVLVMSSVHVYSLSCWCLLLLPIFSTVLMFWENGKKFYVRQIDRARD